MGQVHKFQTNCPTQTNCSQLLCQTILSMNFLWIVCSGFGTIQVIPQVSASHNPATPRYYSGISWEAIGEIQCEIQRFLSTTFPFHQQKQVSVASTKTKTRPPPKNKDMTITLEKNDNMLKRCVFVSYSYFRINVFFSLPAMFVDWEG